MKLIKLLLFMMK